MSSPEPAVLIIDENRLRAAIIEDGLREAGHSRVAVLRDVSAAARTIRATTPDVIIVDIEDPSPATLENVFALARAIQRPVAMFVDHSDASTIERAVDAGVAAYVVGGLSKERIKPVFDMAVARFNALARLNRELEQARSDLDDRKLIEQAKGILMHTRNLSESDAYSLLRSTAMNQNRRMIEVARSLLTAHALLHP